MTVARWVPQHEVEERTPGETLVSPMATGTSAEVPKADFFLLIGKLPSESYKSPEK
jgi:hypothetical protein